MAHTATINQHQAFLKVRINNPEAVRSYNNFLVGAAISAERKHCISVGHHMAKVDRSACYFCGGSK